MRSKNLNYMYNVEYFNEIFSKKDEGADDGELTQRIGQLNRDLISQKINPSRMEVLSDIAGFCSFNLITTYPGLLLGIGYPHDISEAGAVKTGLSLDYVTGAPYLPGSSLKGQLRSWFPDERQDNETKEEKTELIRSFLGEDYKNLDVTGLRDWIFEDNIVFIGAYPYSESSVAFLDMDYITPHNKGKYRNPIPINIMRIKPGVQFRFCFIVPDDYTDGTLTVTADQFTDLFKEILLLGGIGAKTNTGYGRMLDPHPVPKIERPVRIGTCPKCRGDVIWENGAPHCSNNCGLRMGEVHHVKLTKEQMTDFLAGKVITISNGKRYRMGDVKRVFSRTTGKQSVIIDAPEA